MRLVAISILLAVSVPATAAPAFGIRPGAKIATLNTLEKIGKMTWRVAPPDPNPAFVRYDVVATGGSGACQVSGETAEMSKSAMPLVYSNLRKAISGLYGRADPYLGTSSSLIQFGPDSSWTGNRLPKGVGSILLLRNDLDQNQMLTVTLVYTFTNIRRCANYAPGFDRRGL